MKKIILFAGRDDEREFIDKYSKEFNLEVTLMKKDLNEDTVNLAKGFDGVVVITSACVNKNVLHKLKEYGINYISSRSIGYNSIDVEEAKKLGMKVSNSIYSPFSVSEYVVMYSIMLLRNFPKICEKMEKRNYSLKGIIGKELWTQKIGVIGTGRIGASVIKSLSGMGAKILAYDLYPKEELKDIVEYVSFDELLKNSDIITIHLPLNEQNYHIINENTINKMKDGVIIINTARGELIDTTSLIKGLESGKIGGLALDVLEGENGIFYKDISNCDKRFENLEKLNKFDNVIITSHSSFYTYEAVKDMVYSALKNMRCFIDGKDAPNDLTK